MSSDRRSPTRSAAFFDLDKTIIAKSSSLAFSRKFYDNGLINRRAVLRGAYAQLVFATQGADHDMMQKLREQLTDMVTGWNVETVHSIVAETLHDVIEPLVYGEAVDLIIEHQAAGRDVIIVSASNSEVAEPIGAMLGVDHVIATTLKVVDGVFTGDLTFFAYGPNKAEAMRTLAELQGYDLAECFAYSDSETDLPMLEAVGRPFAVNPDKVLRARAAEAGWPILTFQRREKLSSARGNRTTRAVAMAGLLGSAGVIALAVLAGRLGRAKTTPE